MRRLSFPLVPLGAILAGWGLYFSAGEMVASRLAARLGPLLLKLGQGKFADPTSFLQHRLFEALWITTLALLLCVLFYLWHKWLSKRRMPHLWVWEALISFGLINVWVG